MEIELTKTEIVKILEIIDKPQYSDIGNIKKKLEEALESKPLSEIDKHYVKNVMAEFH
jgi:protein required for attachment to host cells